MRLFLLVCCLVLSTSCTRRLGDFTLVTTRNIDMSRMGEYERHNAKITGEDLATIIVFIPTKFQPNIEDAIEHGLSQVPGAIAMIDAVIRLKAWWFIIGEQGFLVEGTVLVDPKLR